MPRLSCPIVGAQFTVAPPSATPGSATISALSQFAATVRPVIPLLTLTPATGQQAGDFGFNLVAGNPNYGKLMIFNGSSWGVVGSGTLDVASLSASILTAGSIDAAMINVTYLSDITAYIGTLYGGVVQATTFKDGSGAVIMDAVPFSSGTYISVADCFAEIGNFSSDISIGITPWTYIDGNGITLHGSGGVDAGSGTIQTTGNIQTLYGDVYGALVAAGVAGFECNGATGLTTTQTFKDGSGVSHTLTVTGGIITAIT